MFSVISVATANKIRVPSELAMLAKTLLQLDAITRKLDVDYNARETIPDYTARPLGKKGGCTGKGNTLLGGVF